MTKDLKQQKLLESKAAAYDSICRLRATTDSHRNFHRLVEYVMQGVRDFERQLAIAPTTECEQFPCMCSDPDCPIHRGMRQCMHEATCTAYRVDMSDESGTLMCDECANDAMKSGLFNGVEESCSELEQD